MKMSGVIFGKQKDKLLVVGTGYLGIISKYPVPTVSKLSSLLN